MSQKIFAMIPILDPRTPPTRTPRKEPRGGKKNLIWPTVNVAFTATSHAQYVTTILDDFCFVLKFCGHLIHL